MSKRLFRAHFFLCLCWFCSNSIALVNALPSNIQLSTQEKQWVKDNPIVRVGGSPDWTPFNFADNDGKHSGLSNDYLSLVAQKTGLTFDISIAPWSINLQRMKAGELDLLPAVYHTNEREDFLNFSDPYFEALDYFFIHDSLDVEKIEDLDGKIVALPKGYAHIEILKKHFPKINIFIVETFGDAIDAVLERKADILYDTYSALQYTLNKEGINSIIPFKSTRYLGKNPIHIVTHKSNNMLSGIINKGLASITEKQKQMINNRWFGNSVAVKKFVLTASEEMWLEENPIIKYGAEKDWAPYDFINLHNQHDGLSKDYIDLIAAELNVKFVPVVDHWVNLTKKIKTNEIDLLPVAYRSAKGREYLSYTTPYQAMVDYIFIREDLVITTKEDFSNKTLAIPTGYSSLELIKQTFPGIKILEVTDISSAVLAVIDRKADFIVNSYAVINFYLKNHGITTLKPYRSFDSSNAHFLHMAALKKNITLINIIDKVLKTIPQNKKSNITNKWLDKGIYQLIQNKLLSEDDIKWLEQHPVITFTGDPNWLPYEAKNKKGEYIGIVADYLNLMGDMLDVTFQYIPANTWNEATKIARTGEVDFISETEDSPFLNDLKFTNGYLSSPIVIVMKEQQQFVEDINSIKTKKIALIEDYGYSPQIIKNYPEITFEKVKNVGEGLTAVSTGEIDAFLAALPQVSYQISEMNINNIRIVGATEFHTSLAFGVNPELSPLVSILNKALASIPSSQKQEIFEKWGKNQFVTKVDYLLIALIVSAFLFVIIIIISWNSKLRREVLLRKEAEIQTNVLLSNIPQQVLVTTIDGKIIRINNKVRSDYNLGDKDVSGRDITEFYQNFDDIEKIHEQLKSHGKVEQLIIPFKKIDGVVHSMMVSVTPLNYKRKPVLLTIAVDVTERIEMEKALEQARYAAEMANRSKSEFLANMSHEIRTPMNAIIGFTELLNEQVVDKKLKVFVNTIQSAGKSLLTLINDILDLSKVEAGKLTLIYEPTSLADLCDEIGNVFLMKIKSKNIDLIIDIEATVPKFVLLDKSRLRQILFNLIGNAVKFTDSGVIKINANAVKLNNGLFDLKISVSDSGIGISEQDQQYIFESFQQREGQDHRKYGGTGLGLTISKRLIELMNGDISIHSSLGEGSCFTLSINSIEQAKLEDSSLNELATVGLSQVDFLGATILIVDDVEDNRELLIEIFSSLSVQLLVANNGKEATLIAESQSLDFVLMDIRMPIMDGYEAAQIIKKLYPEVPIVALTASVMRDDYERQRRENFDGYLRKPVLQKELITELMKHLPHQVVTTDREQPLQIANPLEELSLIDNTLIEELMTRYLPICLKVQKSNQLEEIIKFSNQLEAWAKRYNEKPIESFSQSLFTAADTFDINKIKYLLNEFTSFAAKYDRRK